MMIRPTAQTGKVFRNVSSTSSFEARIDTEHRWIELTTTDIAETTSVLSILSSVQARQLAENLLRLSLKLEEMRE